MAKKNCPARNDEPGLCPDEAASVDAVQWHELGSVRRSHDNALKLWNGARGRGFSPRVKIVDGAGQPEMRATGADQRSIGERYEREKTVSGNDIFE
jgi:hypothetical protein